MSRTLARGVRQAPDLAAARTILRDLFERIELIALESGPAPLPYVRESALGLSKPIDRAVSDA